MALMFLVVLALLTATTGTVTTLARQISGNYKASIQAFQSAEAGAEEARAPAGECSPGQLHLR